VGDGSAFQQRITELKLEVGEGQGKIQPSMI